MNKAYVRQVLKYVVCVLVLEEFPVFDAQLEHPSILSMYQGAQILLLRNAYKFFEFILRVTHGLGGCIPAKLYRRW